MTCKTIVFTGEHFIPFDERIHDDKCAIYDLRDPELKHARAVLKKHNLWRRGADIPQTNPSELGRAIDAIAGDK